VCETASLYSVIGTALYLLLHGMIWEALLLNENIEAQVAYDMIS